jgi:chemotaxis protein methyltransferase CheR
VQAQASKILVTEVSKLVNELTGIQLGESQSTMVHHRVQKRMIELQLTDATAYLSYLKENIEEESKALVSLITTHHTFFFREFNHFEFLEQKGLKQVTDAIRAEGRKTLRIWSAACSRGQEVYSLAMFLRFHLKKIAPDFDFEIFGSDVDPESITIAKNGVYRWNEIKEIPSIYLLDNWVKGVG